MNLATFPFPQVNASLNGASALLLVAALVCIKTRRIKAHVAFVVAALISSVVFLTFYVLFHWYRIKHGIAVTRFPAGNPLRPVYFAVLGSHSVLAVVILPLIVATVGQAMSRRWRQHRSIAVWTFPLWLYVSVTGVVIYWMLSASGAYRVQPGGATAKQGATATNVARAM
jgi:uncharacterized membrane protein YozB (DUF420 family)